MSSYFYVFLYHFHEFSQSSHSQNVQDPPQEFTRNCMAHNDPRQSLALLHRPSTIASRYDVCIAEVQKVENLHILFSLLDSKSKESK